MSLKVQFLVQFENTEIQSFFFDFPFQLGLGRALTRVHFSPEVRIPPADRPSEVDPELDRTEEGLGCPCHSPDPDRRLRPPSSPTTPTSTRPLQHQQR